MLNGSRWSESGRTRRRIKRTGLSASYRRICRSAYVLLEVRLKQGGRPFVVTLALPVPTKPPASSEPCPAGNARGRHEPAVVEAFVAEVTGSPRRLGREPADDPSDRKRHSVKQGGGNKQGKLIGESAPYSAVVHRLDDRVLLPICDRPLYGGQGDDTMVGGQGNDLMFGNEGANTFEFNLGDTNFVSGIGTGDTVGDFKSGTDSLLFTQGPAGTAQNFGSASVSGGSFAALQQAVQGLLNGGDAYAFVSNATYGYLFAD